MLERLKLFALALRNLLVIFVLMFALGWAGFTLNLNRSLAPIIVAEGEAFTPPADFPEFEVIFHGEPTPGRIYFEVRNLSRAELNFFTDRLGFWGYMIEYDMGAQQIAYAQRGWFLSTKMDRFSEDLLTYYNMPFYDGYLFPFFGLQRGGLLGASGGQHVFLNGDYEEILRVGDVLTADFHEMTALNNGNFIYIEVVYVDATPMPAANCTQNCEIAYNRIVEIDLSGNIVNTWDFEDEYAMEDTSEAIVLGNYGFTTVDIMHVNALAEYDDGDFLMSVRNYNEIARVDRETGDVVWHLGGETSAYNDFTFIDDPFNGFSRQHAVTILDNGNILLFDNGNDHQPPTSRVVEYRLDEEEMTATLVWSYEAPDAFFASFASSVVRLPNGNTLINFTERNTPILEVTPDGEINMEIRFQRGLASYQVGYYPWGVDCEPNCMPGTE